MIALQKGNFLGQIRYLTDANGAIASATSYPTMRYTESRHFHETFHLSLILRGGNTEKRKTRAINCLPGTVTFYDPGEVHQGVDILPGSSQVNLEITDQFMAKNDLVVNASKLENNYTADARFMMLKVYRELTINDQDTALAIESTVLPFFKLIRHVGACHKTPGWVSKIKETLYDRWNETLTLNELAGIADLHPANLSGYFPRYFGSTLGEYKRKIKIEKALEQIGTGNMPLTQLAYHCGFADQSHFTRICKQLTGWNPKQLKAFLQI